ncbi:MAG: tRNA uridine-5-carboxymethylaminomethyl(34) synthesis GTPase MnmE [Acidobacteria bacterium]|nr:tRNA uridine-5-carboxymethylaminomethyl(34) synthesis GTPase MnmE [Acidobacteriota bacterium]MBV9147692.1 tRNA uridine-5-carboxymethylaminomethyl(34) synthesis GTPase MnmE [Acidobacteriota bacterium]MBV9435479.1 tRNA uridine-5-carboxymethylaminomethyl(34) synthesis GTPase MnmE [Acidobacteriota bacterium]
MQLDDTIVAVSTPPGRGGIGVVRLSGAEARRIAEPLLRLNRALEPGRAAYGELIDVQTGERIDEIVATFFASPHSYTTEDVVEISAHGSPVVLEYILEMALARGARLAEPGEFTMRGFLHGRIDLTQAEAVRDLIECQTLFQAKVAAQQLEGGLSRRIKPIKKQLVDLVALLEAGIDFAEDDVSVLPDERILAAIHEVRRPLSTLAESFAYGRVVHDGFTLAIVGRPNVGKSSLFNRLVQRERAIVTAVPGTTRDLVTETVSLAGIPLRLVDTAGIRSAADEVEEIGIRKSYEALAEADLVLIVTDPDSEQHVLEERRLLEATAGRKRILVHNKCDLARSWCADSLNGNGVPSVATSALSGEGIEKLREKVLGEVIGAAGEQQERGFLTNLRHRKLIEESLAGLDAAETAVRNRIPHEMLLMDLYSSLKPLDAVTGETTTDDILNLIFSTFCIGK